MQKKENNKKHDWLRVTNCLVYIFDGFNLILITDNIHPSLPGYKLQVMDESGQLVFAAMGDDAVHLQETAFDKLSELKINHFREIVTDEEML